MLGNGQVKGTSTPGTEHRGWVEDVPSPRNLVPIARPYAGLRFASSWAIITRPPGCSLVQWRSS